MEEKKDESKGKRSRFSDLGLLGIPLDPTLGIGDKVLDHIDESIEAEKKKEASSTYWTRCPRCGKKVVKEDLIGKGCYACGWKATKDELEIAEIKKKNAPIQFEIGLTEKKQGESYYTRCPQCGRKLITGEFKEKGCFVCGYKPKIEEKDNG
jgi:ribosomal protein L37E